MEGLEVKIERTTSDGLWTHNPKVGGSNPLGTHSIVDERLVRRCHDD